MDTIKITERIKALGLNEKFATELAAIRGALLMNGATMGALIGVNRTTIDRWVGGKSVPHLGSVKALKEALLASLEPKRVKGETFILSLEGSNCRCVDVTEIFQRFTRVAEQITVMEYKDGTVKIVGCKKKGVKDFLKFALEVSEYLEITDLDIQ